MKKAGLYLFYILPIGLLLPACLEEQQEVVLSLDTQLNPSGYAPLTAKVITSTSQVTTVRVRIHGRNGLESDLLFGSFEAGREFELHILGLYPDYENQIDISYFGVDGQPLTERTIFIQTEPLIADMPEIEVETADLSRMTPGLNLVNYFGHAGELLPQRPFMFDDWGNIRWYLDYTGHPQLGNLFYDNGLIRLRNGRFIFGDGNSGSLYMINMLGEIKERFDLQGYQFHHTLIEKPNGNFLVTVNDPGKPTVEDVIIEIDRNSGQIVNTWDLNESLDNQRRAWPTDLADLNQDWFHANGLAYSETDDCIIVSGRTQGTVKLTAGNEVVWILAPHKDWGTAGNGVALDSLLLQPVDGQGMPILDQAVLDGDVNHPDFEWTWYQHSPILLPNGHLMLFDNGDNRNYIQAGPYSRAVEYEINDAQRLIRQVWDYGKERGEDAYSRIVSKVEYHPQQKHVLYSAGAVQSGGQRYGRVIEVDKQNEAVIFEATITPPTAPFGITFHNVLRMSLYPQ